MDRTRIGPFLLEDKIRPDQGGSTYRAFHQEQRKLAALKVVPAPFLKTSDSAKQAFSQEIDRLKALDHPNIVRCYGGGLFGMDAYLAYEFLDGEPLSALLERRERLAWEQAVEITRQIGEALDHAHSQGVTHQALSPEKVVLTEPLGDVKVVDFRWDRQHNSLCNTSPERLLRAKEYLAPEQVLLSEPATHKADLYALGCILFQMITGNPPHQGDTLEAIAESQAAHTPPPVSTVALETPVWIDVVVGQLLEFDPANRPYGAGAALLALQEAQSKTAAGVTTMQHAVSGFSPLAKRADDTEVKRLLDMDEREPKPQFDIRAYLPWAGVGAAALVFVMAVVVIGWAIRPLTKHELYNRANDIIVNKDKAHYGKAQRYLQEYVEKYPKGEDIARVKEHLDFIDMHFAQIRVDMNLRFNREPKSDGDRLYGEAVEFENARDIQSALIKYRLLVLTLKEDGPDRPYVLLAKRKIEELKQAPAPEHAQVAEIRKQLTRADELYLAGEEDEAKRIWRAIIDLYGGKAEFETVVAEARGKLDKIVGDE